MPEILIKDQLAKLEKVYIKKNKNPISFNFRKKSKILLNGSMLEKKWIHSIHPYPGRILPIIAFYLLSLNELKHLKGCVLDPFSGSGTILLESLINPVIKRSSLGVEINPLARLISKIKTSLFKKTDIEKSLAKIKKEYYDLGRDDFDIPSFINIDLWFSLSAKRQLAKLKFAIKNVTLKKNYRDFFWVSFSKIVRKVSKADPNIPPPVVLKPSKYKSNHEEYIRLKKYLDSTQRPNIWLLFEKSVKENIRISKLYDIDELKNNKVKAKIISSNAKKITFDQIGELGRVKINGSKKQPNDSIDIILTSPPYLTAQKYIRSTRLELLWLGYTNEELSVFEKNTIGTESVDNKTSISIFDINSIDKLIKYAYRKSKTRGLMVNNYFHEMKIVLKELYRVLKKGGFAIFVMGDNVVLKRQVKTYRLFTDLSEKIGFHEVVTLRDKIPSRSMLTKRNGTGGLIKNEYVVILKK